MPVSLPVKEFIEKSASCTVIDVRSEGEFVRGHIPGAVNIPLFNNHERALVGTCYKQKGRQQAIDLGLEIVGPKIPQIVKQVREAVKGNEVLVHCWRGGMRSGSVAQLLDLLGYKTYTLQRGYKAYRHWVLAQFEKPYNLLVLGGKTGSGKTYIIQELKKQGRQVIDLEALACHKGSAFGALGQPEPPTTEMFENLLCKELRELNPAQPVWLEDESHNIGRVFIPLIFWQQMRAAPLYFIEVSKEIRVKNLVRDYATFSKQEIIQSVEKIKKRLGGQHYKAAIETIENNDAEKVTEITLTYYDKAYLTGSAQRQEGQVKTINIADREYDIVKIATLLASLV